MGRGTEKIIKTFSVIHRSRDAIIKYGPHTDKARTTEGLSAGQDVMIVAGVGKLVPSRIVRVLTTKVILVSRVFTMSGKMSKPYKAHVSAIEPA